MGTPTWLAGNSGSWTDGANWSGGAEPGAADTAVIAVAPGLPGLPYTVTLSGADSVSGLDLAQPLAALALGYGSLTVSNTVSLTAGDLLLSSGTLSGAGAGSVAIGNGGSVDIIGEGDFGPLNEISDLAWQGTLSLVAGAPSDPSTSAVLLDNLTFAGAGGTGQGVLSIGADLAVFMAATPLDDLAIQLGAGSTILGDGGAVSIGSSTILSAADGTGISGSDLANAGSISVQAGAYGLDLSAQGSFVNTGSVDVANGASLVIQSATGSNSGLLSAGGGYLRIMATGGFTNTGRLAVLGGTLSLGFALATAQLAAYGVTDGTLGISGALDNTGATLTAGTLAGDQAQYLLLDGGTVSGGTISAAGFAFDRGQYYAAPTGTLSGVTFDGPLRLAASQLVVENGLTVTGPAKDPDRIFISQGGTLTFDGSQSLDHTNINLQGGGVAGVTVTNDQGAPPATLTLGSKCLVTQSGLYATLSAANAQDSILNEGMISADAQGGTLTADYLSNSGVIRLAGEALSGLAVNAGRINASGDASVSFGYYGPTGVNSGLIDANGSGDTLTISGMLSNTGTIEAAKGATLSLQTVSLANTGLISVNHGVLEVGTLTTAQLGTVRLTHAALDVTGRLTIDAADPLRIGTASPSLPNALSVSGTLAGGSVILPQATALQFSGNAGLDGVHVAGTSDITIPLTTLTVSDDTGFSASVGRHPGTINLTGTGSSLAWNSGTAFGNAILNIGSAGDSYEGQPLGAAALLTTSLGLSDSPGGAVQLGPDLTIDQTGTFAAIGDSVSTASGTLQAPSDAFYSYATIQAGAAGGHLTIGGASFTSAGALAIAGGETVTAAATAFTNSGSVSIGAGSTLALNILAYFVSHTPAAQSFTNTGTIALSGGTLTELTDSGSLPAVALLNRGTISGAGTISAPVVNGHVVEAAGGTLDVTGALGGTGSLAIGSGASLVLGGGALNEQASFAGTGGVLAFAPFTFNGQISDFAPGDAIDLLSATATAAAFSGHDLNITLADGQRETLVTANALSGSLTTASDGHGGTTVSFAGAPAMAGQAGWRGEPAALICGALSHPV